MATGRIGKRAVNCGTGSIAGFRRDQLGGGLRTEAPLTGPHAAPRPGLQLVKRSRACGDRRLKGGPRDVLAPAHHDVRRRCVDKARPRPHHFRHCVTKTIGALALAADGGRNRHVALRIEPAEIPRRSESGKAARLLGSGRARHPRAVAGDVEIRNRRQPVGIVLGRPAASLGAKHLLRLEETRRFGARDESVADSDAVDGEAACPCADLPLPLRIDGGDHCLGHGIGAARFDDLGAIKDGNAGPAQHPEPACAACCQIRSARHARQAGDPFAEARGIDHGRDFRPLLEDGGSDGIEQWSDAADESSPSRQHLLRLEEDGRAGKPDYARKGPARKRIESFRRTGRGDHCA